MPQTCRQLAVCGISAMPRFRGHTRWKKNSNLFAQEQPGGDPEWDRRDHAAESKSGTRHPGIGKGKDWQDAEIKPRFERLLGALQLKMDPGHGSLSGRPMHGAYRRCIGIVGVWACVSGVPGHTGRPARQLNTEHKRLRLGTLSPPERMGAVIKVPPFTRSAPCRHSARFARSTTP